MQQWHIAFNTLTLLAGRQAEHPACKKLNNDMLAWLSVERGANICLSSS